MDQDELEYLREIATANPDMFPDIKVAGAAQTDADRLRDGFAEINAFVEQHGREPYGDSADERRLANMLAGVRESLRKQDLLQDMDCHGLLTGYDTVASIEEALEQDDLGILSENADIFDLQHVQPVADIKKLPDYIASRTKCLDFAKFEGLFAECRDDLANEKRTLKSFAKNSVEMKHVEVGRFYYLDGVMVYVAEIGERDYKNNPRLRCIFENGTENDLLIRSLLGILNRHKDTSYLISFRDDTVGTLFDEGDQETGYIYVLKSKSDDPQIADIPNLYKIGYCTVPVLQRIQGAARSSTYLMADVDVVLEMECYGLNPQKTEQFLHTFFTGAKLQIEIPHPSGGVIKPREWFVVPLDVIEEAVDMIVAGNIGDKRYDPVNQVIIERA